MMALMAKSNRSIGERHMILIGSIQTKYIFIPQVEKHYHFVKKYMCCIIVQCFLIFGISEF